MTRNALRTIGGLAVACAVLAGSGAASNAMADVTPAGPAIAAVSGHTMVETASGDFQSDPSQIAIARCPDGKVVVGGGGYVDEWGTPDTETVRMTRMQPVHSAAGDHITAVAEEPTSGFAGAWKVFAVAICVDPLPGYEIVADSTSVASPTFIDTLARCPAGKLVVGTGAKVTNGYGEVWLQLMRPSGPRDIARATAREDADGQDSSWYLTAYAICANPIADTTLQGDISPVQWATQYCAPDGRSSLMLSPGGGGGLTDSGPVWLTGVYAGDVTNPSNAYTLVSMSGLPPGGMANSAICTNQ